MKVKVEPYKRGQGVKVEVKPAPLEPWESSMEHYYIEETASGEKIPEEIRNRLDDIQIACAYLREFLRDPQAEDPRFSSRILANLNRACVYLSDIRGC